MQFDIRTYYLEREQDAHASMQKIESALRVLSIVRLTVFLLFALGIYVGLAKDSNVVLFSSMAFLVAFLVSVRKHVIKQGELRFAIARLNVFRDELLSLEISYDHYPAGEEHLEAEHPYAGDLDLFGKGSIFQYVNRSTGQFGSEALANLLSKTAVSINEIEARQAAVKELVSIREWSENYYASGRLMAGSSQEKKEICDWLDKPYSAFKGVFYNTMLKSLPLLSMAMLVLTLMGRLPWSLFLLYLLIPLAVVASKLKAMNKEFHMLSMFRITLSKYYSLVKVIEDQSWESELLKDEASKLNTAMYRASESFKELKKISEALDNRNNIVGALVLNALLLWDVRYGMRLDRWKEANRKCLPKYFEVIGMFEAMNSLSFLAFNRRDLNFPELSQNKDLLLDAVEMGHLLLDAEQRVNNSFELKLPQRFVILTGANMAGKSTFLRALGSNMILAAAGAPVCAEKMLWRPLPLFSSMRTSDSLQSHESYFYAELKRLKHLLDTADKEKELFIILDEILKGTNSKDKAEGSDLFVRKILSKDVYGIIATHDLSLCSLEEDFKEEVRNMSFDVAINDNELLFDYKIKEGVCKNMNATFLLNKMGLVN